jgi:hypothetical protein
MMIDPLRFKTELITNNHEAASFTPDALAFGLEIRHPLAGPRLRPSPTAFAEFDLEKGYPDGIVSIQEPESGKRNR